MATFHKQNLHLYLQKRETPICSIGASIFVSIISSYTVIVKQFCNSCNLPLEDQLQNKWLETAQNFLFCILIYKVVMPLLQNLLVVSYYFFKSLFPKNLCIQILFNSCNSNSNLYPTICPNRSVLTLLRKINVHVLVTNSNQIKKSLAI